MSTILITHDLGLAAAYCDRVVVMEKGRVVETALSRRYLRPPEHAYTRKLMRATPRLGVSLRDLLPEEEAARFPKLSRFAARGRIAEQSGSRGCCLNGRAPQCPGPRSGETETPLLLVEKLVKEYPRQGATAVLSKLFAPQAAGRAGAIPRGRRHQLSASGTARASAWSGNPAAANPPPR